MRWSWRITAIAGIPLRIHATFLLVLGWVMLAHVSQGPMAVVGGLGFVLALFTCVLLHELGHAIAARRFGVETRDITLLPIGGVARFERIPEEPRQELWIALAGPAVNVMIAGILFLWLALTSTFVPLARVGVATGPFLERLMAVNVALVVFNLLPAFPMDGGRVLRAVLAMRMDHARATHLAARTGQAMALLFALLAIAVVKPLLLLIALFVWLGAEYEASTAQIRAAVTGVPVARLMVTDVPSLRPGEPLGRAVELTLGGSHQDFPVLVDGRVVGILTRADLLRGLSAGGMEALTRDAMRTEFDTFAPSDPAGAALARLAAAGLHLAPVVDRGCLVGLLTVENVQAFLAIRKALAAGGDAAEAA